MTDQRADALLWMAHRQPAPPDALARRLERTGPDGDASRTASLTRAALAELDAARAAPGRVRESALRLLTADALLTYASESALEDPDPASVLESMVRDAAVSDP